jgi:membrane-bound lytic murein transglycosylase D
MWMRYEACPVALFGGGMSFLRSAQHWRIGFVTLVAFATNAVAGDALPRPAGLEPEIDFWRRIFAEVTTNQALIHDNRYLGVVYERVDLPTGSDRDRQRVMDSTKRKYVNILRRLATGDRSGLGPEERRVLALWAGRPGNASLKAAADRVRIQQGLSDRFRQGLVRSGLWREHILESLRAAEVPEALVALPHVESSFNPEARSFVGAAGLWQFTAGTGRRFMRIDAAVDERRDPFRSSEAAARLLRANYHELSSWPLAITAYNHGTGGMRRAKREMGTDDIEAIVRKYDGRTFGFASRNFYVSFLAAEEIDRNPDQWFGDVSLEPARPATLVEVPAYMRLSTLEQALGVSRDTLVEWNPALLPSVLSGRKYVPRGHVLRMPSTVSPAEAGEKLAALPASEIATAQASDPAPRTHRVRRGETLSGIAARYGTSASRLAQLNGLSRRNLIRVGQTIRLPGSVVSGEGAAPLATARTYVVRRGDNLASIAKRTGVPQRRLMVLNSLDNPNRIFPGQRLKLAPRTEGG